MIVVSNPWREAIEVYDNSFLLYEESFQSLEGGY